MRSLIPIVLACVACGGAQQQQQQQPPTPAAPTIVSFTLSHDTLPYGGGDVLLQWRAIDATAVTIDQGVGSQALTGQVYAKVTSSTTFTLTAVGTGGTSTASASVAVAATLQIGGHVIWPDGFGPVPNAAVQVIGKGVVAADSSGDYTFDGATLPYDLAAIAPGGTAAVVFQGVTATHPVVSLFGASHDAGTGSYSARLNGSIDGGVPQDNSHRTLVGYLSAAGSDVTTENSDGTWTFFEYWSGSEYKFGDVVALEYTCAREPSPADGGGTVPDCTRPASYDGFAVHTGAGIGQGGTYYEDELELAPAGTSSVSGTVSWAAGYALSFVNSLLVSHGGELHIESSTASSFGFQVPSPPVASGVRAAIGARAVSPAGEISDAIFYQPASSIPISLPAAPVLITPAAGGTLSASTQLRWSGGASFYLVSVSGPNYHLSLFTRQTSTSLPDLTPLGIALPAASTFAWNVVGYSPTATVDLPPLDAQLPTLASGTAAVSLTSTFKTP